MLVCSMYPNAVRVRPSQGDGGVDVFVPGPAGFGEERAVYQVKKYAENLNSTQKRKIKSSYKRVVDTSKKEGWRITEWHLVMPLDLTSQNLGWLDQVVDGADFPCETNGLLFCDTQAANYPKVIDYYLRDGKDRLQAAMDNLTAVISGRKDRGDDDALAPADVVPDLASIHKALNACDPFYRYDYAVSDSPPPDEPSGEPGLVAVCAMQQDSVWIAIKIFALSLAALEERPIGWQFKVAIPQDDDELRQQFQKFIDYGAPVTMPEGTVSGLLDLPGGLGGDLSGASLQVLSAPDQEGAEQAEFAIAILAPDSDTVIASTTLTRIDLTVGQAGMRNVWREKADLFTLEMLVQAGQLQGVMNLQVGYNLSGRRPAELVDGLKLVAAWHAPNRLAFGLTYGPRDFGVVATIAEEQDEEAKRWAPICEALARIQDHVSVLLRMPAEMTKDQAFEHHRSRKARRRRGCVDVGTFTVTHQDEPEIERHPDRVYEFVAIKAIKFTLGETVITVGKQALFFHGRYAQDGR